MPWQSVLGCFRPGPLALLHHILHNARQPDSLHPSQSQTMASRGQGPWIGEGTPVS